MTEIVSAIDELVAFVQPEKHGPRRYAVRYSWADNPDGNLRNGAGLPASPFRTDQD